MATISGTSAIKNNAQLTCTYSLTVTQGTQSVANNTTTINYEYYVLYDTASVQFVGTTRPNAGTIKVVINGSTVATKTVPLTNGITDGTYIISKTSGTISVPHNADGTKTVSYSISMISGTDQNNYNYVWNASSKTGSLALTTIARQSSISSITGSALGSAVTVAISRNSSSYTHKVEYDFAGSGYTTASSDATTSCSFTPALSLASNIPNATSGTLTVRITTFNGTTKIGSTVTKTQTLSLPASAVPTLTSITATIGADNTSGKLGIYVKGYSTCKLTINGASGVYGSTIKSYSITGGGFSGSSSTYTTTTLNTAGTITFTGTITDSRGRTANKTVSITVYDYSVPSLTITAVRCDSAGNPTSSGTYVKIVPKYTYASVNNQNSVSGTVTDNANIMSKALSTSETAILLNTYPTTSGYTFTASLTDKVSSSAVNAYASIGTDERILNIKESGTGAAFGGFATKDNAVEFFWSIYDKNGYELSLDKIYPVGAVYISTSSTDPGTLFGGTWTQIQNQFLLAAGSSYTAGGTGGASTVTLSASNMPAHTHSVSLTAASAGAHTHGGTAASAGAHTHGQHSSTWMNTTPLVGVIPTSGTWAAKDGSYATKSAGAHTHSITASSAGAHTHSVSGNTGSKGSGTAFSIMPPYVAVYMWKRTA